jgi:formate hydrogenlyase subunit 6/NADH:ubiquinone oxidoreductase subunit I
MPFVKTEVDIKTDYTVQTVDPEWLRQGVKSPKHLMLDPEPCILCRACEDVCPWNCIYMLDPGIVRYADEDVEAVVQNSFAFFVVDDNACTRCSVCVERCPSDCLYYARLPEEESAGRRTMAAVPMSQQVDGDVE